VLPPVLFVLLLFLAVGQYLIIRQIRPKRMTWSGHVELVGEGRKVYRVLVGKSEGKRPPGWPRRRWEDGIRTDLREGDWEGGVEWIQLAQDRDRWRAVVNAVMNLRVLAPQSKLVGQYIKIGHFHFLSCASFKILSRSHSILQPLQFTAH
jgi:hypothetical protein